MDKMGVYGMPGTFPTQDVQFAIYKFFESSDKWKLPRDVINNIYFEYKDAILNQGFSKYGDEKGKTELVEYIEKQTGYELNVIRTVLLFIKNMAQTGDIPNKYYTIESPPTGTAEIISTPFKFLDKQAKNIKWIAVIGIVGVGLYFSWPLLVKGRKKIKRRA